MMIQKDNFKINIFLSYRLATFSIYYDSTTTTRSAAILLQNILYTPQQYRYYPGYAGGAVGDFRAHNTLQ